MFEPSRRDFWGSSARDFLVHPTRTAHNARGLHAAPTPSYTIPMDDTPLLFPDLPVSTRPTQMPLWDVRESASSHVSSMFRETSSSRSVAPPWKQASLFPKEPSYVTQGLTLTASNTRRIPFDRITEQPLKGLMRPENSSLPSLSKAYFRDMEKRSGINIGVEQRTLLKEALQEKKFNKLDRSSYDKHTALYSRKKDIMVAEWERNTGHKWPTYVKKVTFPDGSMGVEIRKADIHHIIPQQLGGPHEWWNTHPLLPTQHQGGVHRSNAVLSQLLRKEIK